MKKVIFIFLMLFLFGLTFSSCNTAEEKAKTEQQTLDELNKAMQDWKTILTVVNIYPKYLLPNILKTMACN